MPKIKIEKVISFSSEDPIHVANNLLNQDPAKKWKCRTAGEKSSSVVLQLETPSVISSIDIGNENSAYIEMLVSRLSSNDDYKILLVMSSFMTPVEARQTINVNKVRMFTQTELSKPECNEKWDRIKIICTQPFNRHVTYGLSFVTLRSPDDKANNSVITPSNLGKFSLRPASPDNISIGSLFARRKELSEEPTKAAAAIREASASPSTSHKIPKAKLKDSEIKVKKNGNASDFVSVRNREDLLYDEDDKKPNSKIDKLIEKKNEEARLKRAVNDKLNSSRIKKNETKMPKEKNDKQTPSTSSHSIDMNKRKSETSNSTSKKPKLEKNKKPFDILLRDVVIVISGIQNPDRANLRKIAFMMGAKYKPDWDNDCTHLICAFAKTPKFNQVKGKGKIVTKKWLEDCSTQRKRLPWRRYALDKTDRRQDESEEEIEELTSPEASPTNNSVNDDTDEENKEVTPKTDIEEEKNPVFDVDTDSESIKTNEDSDLPKLANFFKKKLFYVDKNLQETDQKLLLKYITAYDGALLDDINNSVEIVVTSDVSVGALKELCPDADFVPPDWVWQCHNEQKIISTDSFKY